MLFSNGFIFIFLRLYKTLANSNSTKNSINFGDMWLPSLLFFVYFLGSLNNVSGQSSGLALCKSVDKDDTASVTLGNGAAINLDDTSIASYGRSCQVNLQNEASCNLKIQSGFRVLKNAVCNMGERSNITCTESSHVTVGGKLDFCGDNVLYLEGCRILVMGQADFKPQCKMDMYDSSVFRVYEGGNLIIGQSSYVEMYRGAAFEVSVAWQHAALDEIKAQTTLGQENKITLMDRSSFQVAKGNFFTQNKVTINLDVQASFTLKGDVNMSESSNLIMKPRSKIYIGTPFRAYDPQAAPCLVFTKPSTTLEICECGSLIIQPGAHCMLIASVNITDTVILTADSKDKPYVGCFATAQELITAMSSTTRK